LIVFAEASHFRGLLCVHFRYGLVTRSHPLEPSILPYLLIKRRPWPALIDQGGKIGLSLFVEYALLFARP
jgi:hypothetical protein